MRIFPRSNADLKPNRRFGGCAPRRGGSSSGGGGGGGGTAMAGASSPEGSVTADPGQVYLQTTTERTWNKKTGTGNTGWIAASKHTVGTGTPNGNLVGRPGDSFYSTDLEQRYVKGSGVETNTGWL